MTDMWDIIRLIPFASNVDVYDCDVTPIGDGIISLVNVC